MIMARLIDADKLLEIYKKWVPQLSSKEDEGDRRGVETCIAVLEDMPTMDAVEIVRCKDCKHWHKDTVFCGYMPYGEASERVNWYADDFCSYGERKDGDGNG